MKLDSKFFDRLRVKPDENRLLRESCPTCEWEGCTEPGLYPAPKGRGLEGQYHRYCLDHVRAYNKSYNYFAGLPNEEVVKHQKDDTIGHRPTWFIGVNSWARGRGRETAHAPVASSIASPPTIRSACSPTAPAIGPRRTASPCGN